jgi:hypothetical protein
MSKHRHLVADYYRLYLVNSDLPKITKITESCCIELSSLAKYFKSFPAMLSELAKSSSRAVQSPQVEIEGEFQVIPFDSFGFRLNWERTIALASSQALLLHAKQSSSFNALVGIMPHVYDRSQFASEEDIQRLISKSGCPFELMWYDGVVLKAFQEAYDDPIHNSRNVFAFFSPFTSFQLNVHEEFPTEVVALSEKAKGIAHKMMTDACSCVLVLLKHLWSFTNAIEEQVNPIEAARKMERILKNKKNGTFQKIKFDFITSFCYFTDQFSLFF